MEQVTTIGLDLAKHVFHAHGADASRSLMVQQADDENEADWLPYCSHRSVSLQWKPVPVRTTGHAKLASSGTQ